MRGLFLILAGILLVAGLWFLNSQLPARPDPDAVDKSVLDEQPPEPEKRPPINDSPSSVSADDRESHSSAPSLDVVRIWEEWPQPDIALMISGEQHGYFEPCGCTANQMGEPIC